MLKNPLLKGQERRSLVGEDSLELELFEEEKESEAEEILEMRWVG